MHRFTLTRIEFAHDTSKNAKPDQKMVDKGVSDCIRGRINTVRTAAAARCFWTLKNRGNLVGRYTASPIMTWPPDEIQFPLDGIFSGVTGKQYHAGRYSTDRYGSNPATAGPDQHFGCPGGLLAGLAAALVAGPIVPLPLG
jgi:hypothetical protein